MKYHFKIHKEKKGFWSECIELPGCVTEGDSKEELFENMKDAVNTYLEEPDGSDYLADLPDTSIKLSKSVVEVPVDPSVALAFSIRRERIGRGITQKQAAKMLGVKGLYSYQRLERSCNPTLESIQKLVVLYPNISLDYILR